LLLFLVVSSLLVTLLSPVIGYIYLVSVGGKYMYDDTNKIISVPILLIAGTLTLWSLGMITILEVSDISVGVVLALIIFISTLRKNNNYVAAFFSAGLLQVLYAVIRSLLFGSVYKDRIDTFLTGYNAFVDHNVANLGNSVEAPSELIDTIIRLMVEYQAAIWSITMLLGMYLAMVFLAKRMSIEWKHHLIRFPYWFSYVLIIVLCLAIIPDTRTIGINGLLMIMVFFLIQGLSITDFIARNHFKKSRFIMIATIILIIVNFFFAIFIATIGMLDYWLDIRKLNN